MSNRIITVENLSKRYLIGHQRSPRDGIRHALEAAIRAPFERLRSGRAQPKHQIEEFWALKDISFDVKRGEVLGIIGRNGAGKSTLLKILSRVSEPTSGRISLHGRVASLLEVGTGFHQELTGRENIFLNGSILGMSKAEIRRKFDEIVAFSEVERFLDTPVKRYSSGMYVRLAFSVAAHLEPEILIVDEVLAVGDAQFQKKCLGKMEEVARGGRTVLFVSHNMGTVTSLTHQAILLQDGKLTAAGPSREIVRTYLKKSLEVRGDRDSNLEFYRRDRNPESPVRVTALGLSGFSGNSTALPTLDLGASFTIKIGLDVTKPLHGASLDITLKSSQGERIAVIFSRDSDYLLFLKPGHHTITVRVRDLPLAPGDYFADVGINQSVKSVAYDVIIDYPVLSVANSGQVTHWLDRPWGVLHCNAVEWGPQSTSS